jgi:hypothetical protein
MIPVRDPRFMTVVKRDFSTSQKQTNKLRGLSPLADYTAKWPSRVSEISDNFCL